jgi:hypothetical protein
MNTILSILGIGCLGVFLLVFGGGGVYMIYLSRKSKAQAQSSQIWPGITGRVTCSEVGESTSTDSDGDSHTSYHPRVEYSYQVAGQEFSGKRITFGVVKGSSNPRGAQAVLAKYPLGAAATVFYNPGNPADAVLEKQASGTNTMLVLGIVFLAVAACLALPGFIAAAIGMLRNFTG